MREYFIEYLLGSLDSVTRARVDVYLRTHPQARVELELLEQTLEPLAEDNEVPEAPPGLALKALARIAEYRCALPAAPLASPHQVGTPTRWSFRHADWLVAGILLLLVSGLSVPIIAHQWQTQQRVACSNNLRKFWEGLTAYADRTNGLFPQVEAGGSRNLAGIVVPVLRDSGLLQNVSIHCPAQGNQPPLSITTADLDRLYQDHPEQYRQIASAIGGHYAYSLGYREGNQLHGLRRDSGDELPVMADCSDLNAGNSRNHRLSGQNVLFVGGQVRWCSTPTVGVEGDNIFINHHYQVNAGICRHDSVLGSSNAQAAR